MGFPSYNISFSILVEYKKLHVCSGLGEIAGLGHHTGNPVHNHNHPLIDPAENIIHQI